MIFETVFRVRVVYKSGYTHDFDCTSFQISGGRYEWKAVNTNKPVLLGVDEVAAIWQISECRRLKFFH